MSERCVYEPGDWCGNRRYAVIRLIAAGGIAEVYEVYDMKREAVRALKALQLRHRHNDKIIRKMEAEARAGIDIQHPNLVRVHDAGVDGDIIFFVMELLDGRTLTEEIHWHGRLPLEMALDRAAQIGDAVHALNELGIIHRDLKPDNIFVTKEGVVKVCDLGAAKFERYGLKTTQGGPMGTALYMSPEHIQGGPVDRRTDVYALAHILYQCIAGHHDFLANPDDAPTVRDLTIWQIQKAPTPLTERVRGLPETVWRLVAKGLEKDRERRYASNHEFANAIRATKAWLAERGLLQAGDARSADGRDNGAPDRAVVRVLPAEERVPRNLGYVATEEDPRPAPSAPSAARLVVVAGKTAIPGYPLQSAYALEVPRTVIGRGQEAHVNIVHGTLSRQHAEIVALDDGRFQVTDLGSANGTIVNGSPVRSAALNAGDVIALGDVHLRFELGGASIAAPLTPPPDASRIRLLAAPTVETRTARGPGAAAVAPFAPSDEVTQPRIEARAAAKSPHGTEIIEPPSPQPSTSGTVGGVATPNPPTARIEGAANDANGGTAWRAWQPVGQLPRRTVAVPTVGGSAAGDPVPTAARATAERAVVPRPPLWVGLLLGLAAGIVVLALATILVLRWRHLPPARAAPPSTQVPDPTAAP